MKPSIEYTIPENFPITICPTKRADGLRSGKDVGLYGKGGASRAMNCGHGSHHRIPHYEKRADRLLINTIAADPLVKLLKS